MSLFYPAVVDRAGVMLKYVTRDPNKVGMVWVYVGVAMKGSAVLSDQLIGSAGPDFSSRYEQETGADFGQFRSHEKKKRRRREVRSSQGW